VCRFPSNNKTLEQHGSWSHCSCPLPASSIGCTPSITFIHLRHPECQNVSKRTPSKLSLARRHVAFDRNIVALKFIDRWSAALSWACCPHQTCSNASHSASPTKGAKSSTHKRTAIPPTAVLKGEVACRRMFTWMRTCTGLNGALRKLCADACGQSKVMAAASLYGWCDVHNQGPFFHLELLTTTLHVQTNEQAYCEVEVTQAYWQSHSTDVPMCLTPMASFLNSLHHVCLSTFPASNDSLQQQFGPS